MCDFIGRFAPHLTREVLTEAMQTPSRQELETLFHGVTLPTY